MDAKWRNRPIMAPEDSTGLDTRAAVYEFHHRLPREVAEDHSYSDYKRSKAVEAAAHHLVGTKIAAITNDNEAGAKHGQGYAEAIKILGLNPSDPPPPEVTEAVKTANPYKFRAHAHDKLWQQQEPDAPKPDRVAALIESLKSLRKALKR